MKTSKVFQWLGESNRHWHLLIGLILGLFCGVVATFTAACACEFKDWQHAGGKGGLRSIFSNKYGFDWLDIAATMIGGLIGEVGHYLIFKTI